MYLYFRFYSEAKIAQLGERMTEDHKVRCSIHLLGAFFPFFFKMCVTDVLIFLYIYLIIQSNWAVILHIDSVECDQNVEMHETAIG